MATEKINELARYLVANKEKVLKSKEELITEYGVQKNELESLLRLLKKQGIRVRFARKGREPLIKLDLGAILASEKTPEKIPEKTPEKTPVKTKK